VHADYLMRDEWLRSLVGYLPLEAGVVVVVAGRIRPTWGNAPVAAIPDEFVDAWPVGHLATADALVEYAAVDSGRCIRISWACARMCRWPLSAAAAGSTRAHSPSWASWRVRGPLREGLLFRLAEIELYRGRFSDARQLVIPSG
jgi:hypothetical protein